MSVDRCTVARKVKRVSKYITKWERDYLWLRPVEGDVFKASCIICDMVFSLSSSGLSHVKQHASTRGHIEKALEKNTLTGSDHFIPAYRVRDRRYQTVWEKEYYWVRPVREDESKAKCKICDTVFSVYNNGLGDVKKHSTAKGHIEKALEQKLHSGINHFIQHDDVSKQKQNISDLSREATNLRRRRTNIEDIASTSHFTLSTNTTEVENTSPQAKKRIEIYIDPDDSDDEEPADTLLDPTIEYSTRNSVNSFVNSPSHLESVTRHSTPSSNTIEVENTFSHARRAKEIRIDLDDSDEKPTKLLLLPAIESSAQESVNSQVNVPQKQKQILVVPNHQQSVMSNLSSLWKAGRLCDAFISNGIVNVKVHRMIFGAVCPKVLDIFYNTPQHKFPKVTFPNSVSKEALLAFAEYMYNGALDLEPDLLIQMKVIAQRLDMQAFENLCNNQLESLLPQNTSHTPMEPMLSEPCSSSGLIEEAALECNQTPGFKMSPFSNKTHQNNIDTFNSIAADNTQNVSFSDLTSMEVSAETNDKLIKVVDNNLPFTAAIDNLCDITMTSSVMKVEKDPKDQQYGWEAVSSGIDYSTSESIVTNNFPYFSNTGLSRSSSTAKRLTSNHTNNTLNKSSTIGHAWTQNDVDKGNIDAVANFTQPFHHVGLFTANVSSHVPKIKDEYNTG